MFSNPRKKKHNFFIVSIEYIKSFKYKNKTYFYYFI
jgi:hypothetical protein